MSDVVEPIKSRIGEEFDGECHLTDKEALKTVAEFSALRSRLAQAETALDKINHIRNSIIGLQTMNWSEHIYPLVAALNEAGVSGLSYPEARTYYGTMLERTLASEARAEAAEKENGALREALERIDQWCQAYPVAAFPEPDLAKAGQLLEAGGMTLDAISASNMRHALEGVGAIARAALTGGGNG